MLLNNLIFNSAIVDGFPLMLSLFCWVLMGWAIWFLKQYSLKKEAIVTTIRSSSKINAILQNQVYKRAGFLLLILGFGGFLPSILLLLFTGKVFSVNEQGPHPMVDMALLIHIPLAIIFALMVGMQLWSGDKPQQKKIHRIGGWIAFSAVFLGISVSGGWVWPMWNDFANGLDSPSAGAGFYTMLNGLAIATNAILMVYYAKKNQLAKHKDHALMTLFWTLDPGIHRLYMWIMRLFCWDCWAPENTGDMGIAIAKLPANLSLVCWALVMAFLAKRLNTTILVNASGQFLLWLLGTFALLQLYMGNSVANWVVLISISLWIFLCISSRKAFLSKN